MKTLLAKFISGLAGLSAIAASASVGQPNPDSTVILVMGAPGDSEYASNFVQQATLWEKACERAGSQPAILGRTEPNGTNDHDKLQQAFATEPKDGPGELWLILIGHGTFDGKEARFNLRGPDVSASELALWLQPFHRPVAVINTSSASAPFLNKLSGTNRVVITATRSGHEQNFARFGQYLAEAITDPAADLDKDGQISLLEAFLTASRQTLEFYKVDGRLATEHALLDDNGDGLGTPADWFQGLRAIKKPNDKTSVDGLLAQQIHLVPSDAETALSPEQRVNRDARERAVLVFREKKSQMPEDQYYHELERLLLDLARSYPTNLVQ